LYCNENKSATLTCTKPIYTYPFDICESTYHSKVRMVHETANLKAVDNWPCYFKPVKTNSTSNQHELLAQLRTISESLNIDSEAQFDSLLGQYRRPIIDVGSSIRVASAGLNLVALMPTLCNADVLRKSLRDNLSEMLTNSKSQTTIVEMTMQDFIRNAKITTHLFNFTDVLYEIPLKDLCDLAFRISPTHTNKVFAVYTMHMPLKNSGVLQIGDTEYGNYHFEGENMHMQVYGNPEKYIHPHPYRFLAKADAYQVNGHCLCRADDCIDCLLTRSGLYVHMYVVERYSIGDGEYIRGKISLTTFGTTKPTQRLDLDKYRTSTDIAEVMPYIMEYANTKMTDIAPYKVVPMTSERNCVLVHNKGVINAFSVIKSFNFTFESMSTLDIDAFKFDLYLPMSLINTAHRLIIENEGVLNRKIVNDIITLITLRNPNIDLEGTAMVLLQEAAKRCIIGQLRVGQFLSTRIVQVTRDVFAEDYREVDAFGKVVAKIGSYLGTENLKIDDVLHLPDTLYNRLLGPEKVITKNVEPPKREIVMDDMAYVQHKGFQPKKNVKLIKVCEHELMNVDLSDSYKLDPNHVVSGPMADTFKKFRVEKVKCTCGNHKSHNVVGALKIMSTKNSLGRDDKGNEFNKNLIMYSNCNKTLLAAAFRQASIRAAEDPEMMKVFDEFVDKLFINEIQPILEKICKDGYSYRNWYDHLETKQKEEIDQFLKDIKDVHKFDKVTKPVWEIFCKSEKQIIDDPNKLPKNRSISAPNTIVKYVMGPIIWALETYFRENFFGYECDKAKNWDDMQNKIKEYTLKGLVKLIQGDQSAFDNSQTNAKKRGIDFRIYNYLDQHLNIYHTKNLGFQIMFLLT